MQTTEAIADRAADLVRVFDHAPEQRGGNRHWPSPSVAVIPVHLVHTTEGVGTERHLLIDVFSPPRRDFIAKGCVANARDYAPPADPA